MPLFSHKQLLNLKLSSIKSENLKELADNLGISPKGTTTHPLRYNSFAQFQAYWAEKALVRELTGTKGDES